MEEVNEFDTQVASARSHLEIPLMSCFQAGNKIGEAACKTALSALKIIETQQNPPARWKSVMEGE
jgi:hypothetical protein